MPFVRGEVRRHSKMAFAQALLARYDPVVGQLLRVLRYEVLFVVQIRGAGEAGRAQENQATSLVAAPVGSLAQSH